MGCAALHPSYVECVHVGWLERSATHRLTNLVISQME